MKILINCFELVLGFSSTGRKAVLWDWAVLSRSFFDMATMLGCKATDFPLSIWVSLWAESEIETEIETFWGPVIMSV